MLIPQIKKVKWIDSSIQEHQVDHHDFPKPTIITSIGFVVEYTDDYITLARDIVDKDYRGLVCIPNIAILGEDHEVS